MNKVLKIVLPLTVLAIGLIGGGLLVKFRKQVQSEKPVVLPPLVEVAVVEKARHQFRVQTQGTVVPRTEIQMAVEVSGRIKAVSPSLENGGFFEQDETLLTIDPRDFELAAVQATAQVEDARYRQQLEKAEAEVAKEEWDRLGQGEPNPLLLRKPQQAQAEAALAAAQAMLEMAERDLERCEVKAPFAGRIAQKLVDAGQFVAKGAPIAEIYAVDYAEVRLPLTSDQLAYVALPLDYRGESRSGTGPVARLSARLAGKRHDWEGFIDRVEGKIDVRTRMIFAVARVEDPYGRAGRSNRPPLAAGLFVDAEILGHEVPEAMVLPRSALKGREEVWVIDENSRLHPRTVVVWQADRLEVVIRSGLKEGDRVCLSTLDVVVKGMKVRTRPAVSAEPDPPPDQPQGALDE